MSRAKTFKMIQHRDIRRADREERKRRHMVALSSKVHLVKKGNGNYSLYEAVHYQPLRLEDCIVKKGEEE
jgi:hypothetical protein